MPLGKCFIFASIQGGAKTELSRQKIAIILLLLTALN